MEDKDIKILEDLKEKINFNPNESKYENSSYKQALENLLQAYKQDEKIINAMADFIFENIDTAKICGMISSNDCFKHSDDCNKCIIDYFRKKCE